MADGNSMDINGGNDIGDVLSDLGLPSSIPKGTFRKACVALMAARQRLQQQQQQHQALSAQMEQCLQKHRAEDVVLAHMRQMLQEQQRQEQALRGPGVPNKAALLNGMASQAAAAPAAAVAVSLADASVGGLGLVGQFQATQQQQLHSLSGGMVGNNQLQLLQAQQNRGIQSDLFQQQQQQQQYNQQLQQQQMQGLHHQQQYNQRQQQQQQGAVTAPGHSAAMQINQLQPQVHHQQQQQRQGGMAGFGPASSALGGAYSAGLPLQGSHHQHQLQQPGLVKSNGGGMPPLVGFEGEGLAGVVPDLPGLDTVPSLPLMSEAAFDSLLNRMVFN
jgi:hypothetical protein